jgi:CHASE3 domain sensor protein
MTAQEQFAYPGAGTEIAEPTGSAGWWQSRSLEQLEEYVDRGIAGGEMFYGACAEIERREKNAEAELRARAADAARRFRRQKIALLAGGLVLVLGALAIAIEGR